MGDIGQYFPSDDENWKNAQSQKFLEHAQHLIEKSGFSIVNIDTTVILQEPRLSPYTTAMRKNIAKVLSISPDAISVKATTTDSLGFIGQKKGICAIASVLICKDKK